MYVGAVATFVLTLAPYITACIFPSYVIGAMVAVWYAVSKQNQTLTLKDGAKLGFLSSALGTAAACVLIDLIWQVFDYQLWHQQNGDFMIAIFRSFAGEQTIDAMKESMAQQAAKSFAWYIIIVQIIAVAIIAGIFGTIGGLIAASVFKKKPAGQPA